MQTKHSYLAAMLAAAFVALASTLAAAPPAAAECVSSRGPNPVTLCSQGDTRVSNKTPLPATTPFVPYPCDMDWSCDQGLSIALGD
jgi:hypothetical protein